MIVKQKNGILLLAVLVAQLFPSCYEVHAAKF